MFDFDVGKLVVIGAVALIVIGPKDLPRVLRQVGQAVGKMRRMANEFQTQFMDAMKEADVDEVKKDLEKAAEAAKIDVAFDPLKDVREQMTSVTSDVNAALDDAGRTPEISAATPEIGNIVAHDTAAYDEPPPPLAVDLEQPNAFETVETPATPVEQPVDQAAAPAAAKEAAPKDSAA